MNNSDLYHGPRQVLICLTFHVRASTYLGGLRAVIRLPTASPSSLADESLVDLRFSREMPVPDKRATIQIALSTIVPLILGLCAPSVTMVIGEHHWDTMPFVLVGWCVALGLSAVWLNWAVFRRTKTLLPFMAAVMVTLLIWAWQRLAFTMLVPHSGLTYGFFLRPEGAKARFWTLTCPFRVGLTALSLCFIAGLVSAWRAGFRGLLACIIPWWLTAFLIFSLPSMHLDAQGNASVFI